MDINSRFNQHFRSTTPEIPEIYYMKPAENPVFKETSVYLGLYLIDGKTKMVILYNFTHHFP